MFLRLPDPQSTADFFEALYGQIEQGEEALPAFVKVALDFGFSERDIVAHLTSCFEEDGEYFPELVLEGMASPLVLFSVVAASAGSGILAGLRAGIEILRGS